MWTCTVGPTKQFESVNFGVGKLWWPFFSIFFSCTLQSVVLVLFCFFTSAESLHLTMISWGFICGLSACVQYQKWCFHLLLNWCNIHFYGHYKRQMITKSNVFSLLAWGGCKTFNVERLESKWDLKSSCKLWFCWVKSNVIRFMTQVWLWLQSSPLVATASGSRFCTSASFRRQIPQNQT